MNVWCVLCFVCVSITFGKKEFVGITFVLGTMYICKL